MSLIDKIRTRANFVAGENPYSRDAYDSNVDSAIADAIKFLANAPDYLPSPQITGGTTATPDDIVVLYWVINVQNSIQTISVHFKGNDRCSIYWSNTDSVSSCMENITIAQLKEIDIADELENFRSGVSKPTRYKPTFH